MLLFDKSTGSIWLKLLAEDAACCGEDSGCESKTPLTRWMDYPNAGADPGSANFCYFRTNHWHTCSVDQWKGYGDGMVFSGSEFQPVYPMTVNPHELMK